jgi:hypothetical protein
MMVPKWSAPDHVHVPAVAEMARLADSYGVAVRLDDLEQVREFLVTFLPALAALDAVAAEYFSLVDGAERCGA